MFRFAREPRVATHAELQWKRDERSVVIARLQQCTSSPQERALDESYFTLVLS